MAAGFLYDELQQGIRIVGCKGLDPIVEIPEMIEGKKVVELGSYAFSASRRTLAKGVYWHEEEGFEEYKEAELPDICGSSLEEIHLPSNLKKIGAYAFYNCGQLKRISCSSTIEDIGAGVFTGCNSIALLDIDIVEGQKSCLKEILTELKQTLWVRYRAKEEALLLFPEFYEESVENTPARLLVNQTHGCGHRYRYCFQETQFQFRDYDSVFPYLKAVEPTELVVQMVTARLFYPCGLTAEYGKLYREYLEEYKLAAAKVLMEQQKIEELRWLMEEIHWTKEEVEEAVEMASKGGYTQILSYFMDYSHKKFPPVKKKFEL